MAKIKPIPMDGSDEVLSPKVEARVVTALQAEQADTRNEEGREDSFRPGKKDIAATLTYLGCKIQIRRDNGKFYVPLIMSEVESFADAKAAIDRAAKTRSFVERRKVSVPVVSDKGTKHTVRGIHSGHAKLLADPPLEGSQHDNLYPDLPWVHEAIKIRDELERQVHVYDAVLGRYKINRCRPDYFTRTTSSKELLPEDRLEKFVVTAKHVTAIARNLNLKKAVAEADKRVTKKGKRIRL